MGIREFRKGKNFLQIHTKELEENVHIHFVKSAWLKLKIGFSKQG